MRHLKSGSKLGRNPWHRRATLRNLVTNLFEHGRITTTLTRAKAARPVAEKLITLGKRDTLASRRQAAAYIFTPGVTKKLFSEIAPKFADRAGGYTRIISAGRKNRPKRPPANSESFRTFPQEMSPPRFVVAGSFCSSGIGKNERGLPIRLMPLFAAVDQIASASGG
jgi:large subunit ribosomal protein L17